MTDPYATYVLACRTIYHREPISRDAWLDRNPWAQPQSSSSGRTWSCGWIGLRCIRFACHNTGPCDGFRSDIEFDHDKETRGDAQ